MAPRLIRLFKLCSSQQYKSYSSERLAVIVHYVHPTYFCNFNKRELLLLFCKSWIYKYYFTWIAGPPFLKIWDFAHVWYSICTWKCPVLYSTSLAGGGASVIVTFSFTPTLSEACSLHARWLLWIWAYSCPWAQTWKPWISFSSYMLTRLQDQHLNYAVQKCHSFCCRFVHKPKSWSGLWSVQDERATK